MQNTQLEADNVREIDIMRLLRMLWKRVWIIMAVAALAGLIGFITSAFIIKPTYRTQFTAYISNRDLSDGNIVTSSSDLTASKGLMYVYQEIVVSHTVLTQAAAQCNLFDQGYSLSSNMVSARVAENAPILTVYVETTNPELSKQLADAIAEISPAHVSKIVAGSTMTLIDAPYTPTAPSSPSVPKYTLFGIILGAMLAVAVLVALDLILDHVVERDDMESRYHIPVVARIPDVEQAQKNDFRYYGQTKERGADR